LLALMQHPVACSFVLLHICLLMVQESMQQAFVQCQACLMPAGLAGRP
jgi:hypothetical protein